MSTIDPAEVRRQRQQSKVGSTRALVRLLVTDLILCGAAAVLARTLYNIADLSVTQMPPLAVIIGLPVGALGTLLGSGAHFGALRSYTGQPLGVTPFLGILPLIVIGAAAGAWWGWWATDVGLLLVPWALTGLAVLALAITAVRRVARRTQLGRLTEVMRSGQLVTGVITAIPTVGPSSSGLIAEVTVKFTDPSGVERWVTKRGQWLRAQIPKNGDAASVLFDPRDPGDLARIWLGPAGPQSPADFVSY